MGLDDGVRAPEVMLGSQAPPRRVQSRPQGQTAPPAAVASVSVTAQPRAASPIDLENDIFSNALRGVGDDASPRTVARKKAAVAKEAAKGDAFNSLVDFNM
jgi:hypothetical protein